MRKSFWIGLLLALMAVGIWMLTQQNNREVLSPPAEQRITTESGLVVRIDYSRPSKRGRLIFGNVSENALQPYGEYWRLGANAATVFEFSDSIMIDGTTLEPGAYGVYAFPGIDSFEIGFNQTWDRWGLTEPDFNKDVVRFKVPVEYSSTITEQFTISLGEGNHDVRIICAWDNIRFVIPIKEIQ